MKQIPIPSGTDAQCIIPKGEFLFKERSNNLYAIQYNTGASHIRNALIVAFIVFLAWWYWAKTMLVDTDIQFLPIYSSWSLETSFIVFVVFSLIAFIFTISNIRDLMEKGGKVYVIVTYIILFGVMIGLADYIQYLIVFGTVDDLIHMEQLKWFLSIMIGVNFIFAIYQFILFAKESFRGVIWYFVASIAESATCLIILWLYLGQI